MMPGKDDAEFACGPARRRNRPHFVKDNDAHFDYRIEEVHAARWVNVGQPGTYPIRQSWHAPRAAGDEK